MTYLNDKTKHYTQPLAEALDVPRNCIFPAMCGSRDKWKRCSKAIRQHWGRLDIAMHSIAFAPREDLQGRVVDCSGRIPWTAMDVSCYSFIGWRTWRNH